MTRGKAPPPPDRRPAMVMSVLGAAAFGYVGISTLIDHTITWPGRSGEAMRLAGTDADLMAWLLLAAATACVALFMQAANPAARSLRLTGVAFAVWFVAAAIYFIAR